MKKIKLKLSNHDLQVMIDFIEYTYPNRYLRSKHEGKLIESCLAELLHKLSSKSLEPQLKYSITISVSQGLALLIHAKTQLTTIQPREQVIINNIVGIIDQKTI